MFTSLDKAIVALVMALVYIFNNLFGVNIGLDPAVVNNIVVALTPILVWLIPNRKLP